MTEENGGTEIVIKGASVHVQFDDAGYTRNGNNHEHQNKKITKIVVVDQNGIEKFSSGDNPGGLKWTVTVTTK